MSLISPTQPSFLELLVSLGRSKFPHFCLKNSFNIFCSVTLADNVSSKFSVWKYYLFFFLKYFFWKDIFRGYRLLSVRTWEDFIRLYCGYVHTITFVISPLLRCSIWFLKICTFPFSTSYVHGFSYDPEHMNTVLTSFCIISMMLVTSGHFFWLIFLLILGLFMLFHMARDFFIICQTW